MHPEFWLRVNKHRQTALACLTNLQNRTAKQAYCELTKVVQCQTSIESQAYYALSLSSPKHTQVTPRLCPQPISHMVHRCTHLISAGLKLRLDEDQERAGRREHAAHGR